ncbi:MAG: DUF975 family protein [Victivallaceae bacterium]
MSRTVLVAPVPNRDITAAARAALKGHWKYAVLMILAFFLFNMALQQVTGQLPYFIGLSVIGGYGIQIGVCRFFLNRARGAESDDFSVLKLGFVRFGNVLLTMLLMTLWIFLKTLLLIIPGILAVLDYAMVQFILADDPLLPPRETLKRSKQMMYGHRWQFICLNFRFIGWAFLCLFTLGIGLLWLIPYFNTALARFYDTVRPLEPVAEPDKGLLVELTPMTETSPMVGAPPLAPFIPEATGTAPAPAPYRGYSLKTSIILAVVILLLCSPFGYLVRFNKIKECRNRMTTAAMMSRNGQQDSFVYRMIYSCPDSGRKYISGREFIDFTDDKSLPHKILLLELPGSHPMEVFNVAPARGPAMSYSLKNPTLESFIALLKEHYDLDDGLIQNIRDAWAER